MNPLNSGNGLRIQIPGENGGSIITSRYGTTTCSFCSKSVLINLVGEGSPSEDDEKRQRFVKNVCKFQGVKNLLVPEKLSEQMIPFCADCELLVEQFSSLWNQLEDTFGCIEAKVANGQDGGRKDDAVLEVEKWMQMRSLFLNNSNTKGEVVDDVIDEEEEDLAEPIPVDVSDYFSTKEEATATYSGNYSDCSKTEHSSYSKFK